MTAVALGVAGGTGPGKTTAARASLEAGRASAQNGQKTGSSRLEMTQKSKLSGMPASRKSRYR